MTTLNFGTQRATNFVTAFVNATATSLFEVYDNPSMAKQRAYSRCREQCYVEHGLDFCVISHNTFGFSVAWTAYIGEDRVYGLRVETPQNSYFIPMK